MTVLQNLSKISASYPEGLLGEALEHQIEQTLPRIHELGQALTQSERLAVLNALIAKQQAAFIANHGDPFGCETMGEPQQAQSKSARVNALNAT